MSSPRVVAGLGCLRGVTTLTGFGLAVEMGGWDRFTGNTIGAYVGLVPSEYSSGASRTLGPVTKTGNSHVRRLLVEAAWHHRPQYRVGKIMQDRWDRPHPRPAPAGMPGTGGCINVGWGTWPNGNARTSRTLPLPASWPAGAGR